MEAVKPRDASSEGQLGVLIVCTDEDVRDLLRTMVEIDGRFCLAGCVTSWEAALPIVRHREPHAIVIDLDPDDVARLHDLRRLGSRRTPDIVVMSAFPDPCTLLAALEHGASGYIDRGRAWGALLPMLDAACSLAESCGTDAEAMPTAACVAARAGVQEPSGEVAAGLA